MYIRDPGVVIPHYIIGKLTKMTKNHEKSWLNMEQVSIVQSNHTDENVSGVCNAR